MLVADVAALHANIAQMQALADDHGVALRPHAKGHLAPWIAQRQVDAGAVGVAVATLTEAALFVKAGLRDVLLTTVLAPQSAVEVMTLASCGALTVVVHHPDLVATLERAASRTTTVLPVLIDLDVGQRRGGAATPEAALAVADAVAGAPHLRLRGVQGYDGHLQGLRAVGERTAGHVAAMGRLDGVLGALRSRGFAVDLVTSAGTGTAALAAAHPTVTEIQPGSYALMDHSYAALPGVSFAQAAFVLSTVTAVLAVDEVIIDAGARRVSTDAGPPKVDGCPDVRWESAGDEHGRLLGAVGHLRTGDRVRLVPSHTDTTVVLYGTVCAAP